HAGDGRLPGARRPAPPRPAPARLGPPLPAAVRPAASSSRSRERCQETMSLSATSRFPSPLGHGLLTMPLGPTGGLPLYAGSPRVGRGGTVGRPCPNGGLAHGTSRRLPDHGS